MQYFKVILVVACFVAVASAASWPAKICDACKENVDKMKKELPKIEADMVDKCKMIGIKDATDKCIEVAKSYIEHVAKSTSEQLCQEMHLCPQKQPPFFLGRAQEAVCSLLCEPCKLVAQQVKAGAPQAKDQLKQLCKNCGAKENVQKCEKAIDKFIEKIEEKTPEQLCTEMGLCKKQ